MTTPPAKPDVKPAPAPLPARKFFTDPRFYVPVLLVVAFEVALQLGAYDGLLKPESSYAESVKHIQRTVARARIEPNVLILGTSVAYQGIILPKLNRRLAPAGLVAQSGAAQGAKLITQHVMYRSLKRSLPRTKLVVLVSEVSFPWAARRGIDEPNLSMVSQFPRLEARALLDAYKHELTFPNRLTFYLRSYGYRRDMRAFLLAPLKRLKRISRKARRARSDYPYVNTEHRRISVFRARNLHECLNNARNPAIPGPGPDGKVPTNRHHRGAVLQTCQVGLQDPGRAPGGPVWNRLFFDRLKLFHEEIKADGAVPITVFAPYSSLIRDMNSDERLALWHKNLTRIHGKGRYHIIDLRRTLDGPENGDLFYDTIHLNRAGADKFTRVLAERLAALSARILQNKQ